MKLARVLLLLWLLSSPIFAPAQLDPNRQIDEGWISGNSYFSKEISWTMQIPDGWQIMTRDAVLANDKVGENAMEKSLGSEIDISTLKHLITFRKDPFNIFGSTIQPFKEAYQGEYSDNQRNIYNLLWKTFADAKIRIDTASGTEVIKGLKFDAFYITLFASDNKIIMKQIMYSRLLNGYDFGVTIAYNNEADKQVLLAAFHNSKFEK